MPYYQAGDYYQGDYYQGGDYYQAGGLFGKVGKFLGGVAKRIVGATPVGQALNIVAPKLLAPPAPRAMVPVIPEPGLSGFVHRIVPGGSTGLVVGGGGFGGGRRRMNVLNPKALSRAGRRINGFVKKARRVMRHTSYTVVRRGSGAKRRKR